MKRRALLKNLGLTALAPFSIKIAAAADQSVFVLHKDLRSVFISRPELCSIRAAVQSLAGRANLPFEDHLFRGFLGQEDIERMGINASQDKPEYEPKRIPGTGVAFTILPHFKGAIIFARLDTDMK